MKIKIIKGRGWYEKLEGIICDVVYFRNKQGCYMVKDPLPPSCDPQSGILSYIMPEDCVIVEVGEIPIRNMWLEE
jgi:hypothetical protein